MTYARNVSLAVLHLSPVAYDVFPARRATLPPTALLAHVLALHLVTVHRVMRSRAVRQVHARRAPQEPTLWVDTAQHAVHA
jgi:hypothetical protein